MNARKGAGSSPTGVIGRRLARRLLAAGDRVRVLAEPEQAVDWPTGTEVVEGSVTRPAERAEAFAGTDTLFLAGAVPATVHEALGLARVAGTRRIVTLSSHGPEYEEAYPPETWFWLAVERAVEAAGMEWTHIRPSAVMGAVLEGTYPATGSDWPDTVRREGTVREAFLEDGHYPFVHEEDLAAVAATALRTADHVGTVLEAVGPPLSTRDRLESIARATGRPITAVDPTPEAGREAWREQGRPDDGIEVTLFALREYARHLDELTQWTLDQRPALADPTGRPPRTSTTGAEEHVHIFR
ncbi:NAD(P)H-binding protein [Streptomyces avidinii]|uniref:NAD(P)H-binding protein n=1 Tax=Streptomyces avidinii TaxID=1895 RepID=UPI00386D1286|nr:NAD(P)H-binding protein [Streptomyces avidinii]